MANLYMKDARPMKLEDMKNKFFIQTVINMDGDMFAVAIPTVSQLSSYFSFLRKQSLMDRWNRFWQRSQTSQIFIQEDYDPESGTHMVKRKLKQNTLACASIQCSILPKIKYFVVPETQYLSQVGYMPVLIPLDREGVRYDFRACPENHEFEISWGGSFVCNQEIIPFSKKNGLLCSIPREEILTMRIGDSVLPLCNPKTGESYKYDLPWVQVDGGFMCLRSLICNSSLKRYTEFLMEGRLT